MPKQKHQHHRLSPLLKSIGQDNIPLEDGSKRSAIKVRIEAAQIAGLKRLAREYGTTLAQELDNAVDAYCLGVSRREIRLLHALLDRMNESTAKAHRALATARRETKKTRAHFAWKRRPARSSISRHR